MAIEDISPLELLEALAPSVPKAQQQRFNKIYDILASNSPLLTAEQETQYNTLVARAKSDLVEILREMSSRSTDPRISRLLRFYSPPIA